ncbi:lariat debranching enzyme isoform X3 [Macadamia integrifolia]|uniref:lariat debranching enzyme isoform X3 n=1 Tax=Macadamia integrifolia TaxID=60698 RepID=UPI001C4FA284|nr:lariat debranching enzyme isoform X3 [Macadamia integrifolia]
MRIAVEGCMHGDLDNVYATLLHLEKVENTKIDLLLCCGDFQAVRNEKDLHSVNVPPKYRSMNSFWKYYSGQEVAPFPTIFIGGNHEASNYLWELYYGGWAAPNIYFLGFGGVIKFGNIRIGGLSGIYNARHYQLGHYERPPYNESDIRSIYHVREYDVLKLMQVEEPIDIFLSHDWPLGITDFGNWKELVRRKPFFEKEIQERTLGSKAAAELLDKLKPPYWFSAHLHCKFAALVQHGEGGAVTKFLALDKCLPGRKFLQIVEIESEPGPYEIHYDEEWMAITRKFNCIFPLTRKCMQLGGVQLDSQDCLQWVRSRLKARGSRPFDFIRTVPSYDPFQSIMEGSLSGNCRNPQTESLLQFLELPYLLDNTLEPSGLHQNPVSFISRDNSEGVVDEDIEDAAIDDMDEVEELEELMMWIRSIIDSAVCIWGRGVSQLYPVQ